VLLVSTEIPGIDLIDRVHGVHHAGVGQSPARLFEENRGGVRQDDLVSLPGKLDGVSPGAASQVQDPPGC
jgi:hypothetical protein